jgi:hypothetical protein
VIALSLGASLTVLPSLLFIVSSGSHASAPAERAAVRDRILTATLNTSDPLTRRAASVTRAQWTVLRRKTTSMSALAATVNAATTLAWRLNVAPTLAPSGTCEAPRA